MRKLSVSLLFRVQRFQNPAAKIRHPGRSTTTS